MGDLSRGQTIKNLSSNMVYFVANVLIGIFLVPFFIGSLGIGAYGLIPLATSFIGYLGLLTNSLNSAVSRHLTIDMQDASPAKADRTFNSAFFGISFIVLLAIPLVLIISYLSPILFRVGPENFIDTMYLFLGIGGAFLLRSWSSTFTVTLYSSNRLDLVNAVNLTNIVVQLCLIILFFNFLGPSLYLVGLSYFIGALAATILTLAIYLRTNKGLSIDRSHFDGQRFKEMARMGGWIVINDVGTLLLLNIDLIIVNYLYGTAIGGEYAVAYQWVILLRGLASTFVSILRPIILISFAKGLSERIILFSKSAVKLTGLGIALPVGLICGFAPIILNLWVSEDYVFLAPLMVVLTSHLVINTCVIPLFHINVAYNKVRLPAAVTLFVGVANVVMALALAAGLGWGTYGVAAASLICLTLKNLIFTPLNASKVLGISRRSFYPSVIPGAIAMVCIAIISFIITKIIPVENMFTLVAVSGLISIIYAFLAWKYLLNENERNLVPLRSRSA